MKRVLTMIHTPTFGGPHTQMERLSGPLAARGWELLAVLPDEPGNGADRLRAAGVAVEQMPLHRLRASFDPRPHWRFAAGFFPEVRHIRRLIVEKACDVVLICGVMHPHGALAAYAAGVPVAWYLLSTFAPMSLRRVLMPVVTRLADVVISTGMKVAQQHPGAVRLGNRLVPFFPPVDTTAFVADPRKRTAARAELGIPDDALVIGTVGNQNRQKAHEFFVKAAARIRREIPQTWFRILGAPTATQAAYYERDVKAEAVRLGLTVGRRLAFLDPGNRVAELLPAFDLFLLTSRAEGVPTVVLEAMSCGIPVVATDVGSVSEVVEEGVTGMVVPSEDEAAMARAVVTILQNPTACAAMGRTAREHAVQRYDTAICADTHVHAFETALAHHQLFRKSTPPLVKT